MKKTFIAILCLITLSAPGAFAQENNKEEHHHSHHFSLFVFGVTNEFQAKRVTWGYTVGFDYEFRLPFARQIFGIGALSDFKFGETGSFLVAAGFIGIHPVGGLKILIAPGIEKSLHSNVEFLIRGSIGYDFQSGIATFTPIVSADYIPSGKIFSLDYGLSCGIGF